MAPASLSLLTVTFTEPAKGAGPSVCTALSPGVGRPSVWCSAGSSRSTPPGAGHCSSMSRSPSIAALAATRFVNESRSGGESRYDIPGALTSTAGLLSLVYGFTRAETDGWASPITLSLLSVGVLLLVAFVLIERRSTIPLLPLRVVLDRNRGGSFLASLLVGIALFGTFLFLTYYMQAVLGYSALKTGFAFLPFSAGIIFSATLASSLLPKLAPHAYVHGPADGRYRSGLVSPDRGPYVVRDPRPGG